MRDTVARFHCRIDTIDIDHAVPIIEGHIDATEISVLLKDPCRHGLELLIGPVTDQLLREIHMHFARGPCRRCADPA